LGEGASTDARRGRMQHISDQYGSISVAWVGEGVLYARFANKISADVGERYAAQLTAMVGGLQEVRYFADSRNLANYDILARSAIVRAVLANRKRFASIIVLTWAGGVGPISRTFASAIGDSIEYVTEAAEFEARLLQAAPDAKRELDALTASAPRPKRRRGLGPT
jgi:hypothetical protein